MLRQSRAEKQKEAWNLNMATIVFSRRNVHGRMQRGEQNMASGAPDCGAQHQWGGAAPHQSRSRSVSAGEAADHITGIAVCRVLDDSARVGCAMGAAAHHDAPQLGAAQEKRGLVTSRQRSKRHRAPGTASQGANRAGGPQCLEHGERMRHFQEAAYRVHHTGAGTAILEPQHCSRVGRMGVSHAGVEWQ